MKVAVFDLDGTLIDSAPDLHAAANAVLGEEGLNPITLAQARAFVGEGAGVFVRRMMETRALPAEDALHARLLARFLALYQSGIRFTRPFPQALDTLASLRAAGWRLGLCTNKPIAPTHAVLDALDMAGLFSAVIGGDSLARRKPDPLPLHKTLAEMGVRRALYVGDSEIDAQTAHAAGQPFALFKGGYRKAPVETLAPVFAFDDHAQLGAWCLDGGAMAEIDIQDL